MNLTEFLLARIAEDEAAARATLEEPDPLDWGDSVGDAAWHMHGPVDGPSGYASLVVDPIRVLAECEAKRRIVEVVTPSYNDAYSDDLAAETLAAEVLQLLALPYADHPDYQPEWRP